MNINDFEAPEYTPDWLKDIFEKQTELLEKYKDIEKMPPLPVSIHTRAGQVVIKDFLWRTSEELAESYEAYVFIGSETDQEKMEMHMMHNIEELVDALHFLIELIIIVGKDWKWAREILDNKDQGIDLKMDYPAQSYWAVSYYLGLIGNTLKNKPWKQTEMPTDQEKFFVLLGKSLKALFLCFETMDADETIVFNVYSRKNQVNQFRQRSNY